MKDRPSFVAEPVPAKAIPGPQGHWFWKNGREIAGGLMEFLQKYGKIYPGIYRARGPILGVVILTDPELVKYVLQDNQRNYEKSYGYRVLRIFLGNGLLTNEGENWKRQRRLAQPAFHRQRLAALVERMGKAAEGFSHRWEQLSRTGKSIDMQTEMNELTMQIVAEALFSADVGTHIKAISQAVEFLNEFAMKRILSLVKLPQWLPTPGHLEFNRQSKILDDIIYSIIAKRRKEGHKREDLLAMLMEAKYEDTGEKMSDLQLRDEAMTIFIAGHETTATSMTWTWYLLSKNPQVFAKLREELKNVLDGRTPTFDDLPSLAYTRQVIDESLRLYPPGWVIGRSPIEADELGGYQVSKGENVLLATYFIHHDPQWWEDPETFNPDRFEGEKLKELPRFAYFPFGGGPRLCIGNNFALMEMQVILATLAQHFRPECLPGQVIEIQPIITLKPKNGIDMKIFPT